MHPNSPECSCQKSCSVVTQASLSFLLNNSSGPVVKWSLSLQSFNSCHDDNLHPLGQGHMDLLPVAVQHLCCEMLWKHANFQGDLHLHDRNAVHCQNIQWGWRNIIFCYTSLWDCCNGNVTYINSTDCIWISGCEMWCDRCVLTMEEKVMEICWHGKFWDVESFCHTPIWLLIRPSLQTVEDTVRQWKLVEWFRCGHKVQVSEMIFSLLKCIR